MPIMLDKDTENKTLEIFYPIAVGESDKQYYLKPAAMFSYMQDIAAKGINHYDPRYCWDELYKKGRGWFLTRYRVEFENYPHQVSEIRMVTESRGCHRMNAYRDFEAYDAKSGQLLMRGGSSWLIVDLADKSILNIHNEYPDFPLYEKQEDDLSLNKIRSFDVPDSEKVFHVRYDDLDINNHVNNTVYITWAMEALDLDFRSSHVLKSVDLNFKHEVGYGEDILSQVKYDRENLVTEHIVKNARTGDELCIMRAEYVKK